ARASASASWKTSGTASSASCAAKPTSISGSATSPASTTEMGRPRLALVPGEPAGVGPELCVSALQHDCGADITVFGDRTALLRAAHLLDLPLSLDGSGPGNARLVEIPHPQVAAFGTPVP